MFPNPCQSQFLRSLNNRDPADFYVDRWDARVYGSDDDLATRNLLGCGHGFGTNGLIGLDGEAPTP